MSRLLKIAWTVALAIPFIAPHARAQTSSTQPPASSDRSDSADAPKQSSSAASDAPASTNSAQPSRSSSLAPPRSDRVQADDLGSGPGDSSSKDTQVDLSAPKDDAKEHPRSSSAVADAEEGITPDGVSEFRTWDPHRASKDIEVGDFYFKRGNYRAAEDRYREALSYKSNDAVATFRLAESLEKLGLLDDARAEYESYMKILPHGPEVQRAQKAIERLKAPESGAQPQ